VYSRGADEDEYEADVQIRQVTVAAVLDGRGDAVTYPPLGFRVVPDREESVRPDDPEGPGTELAGVGESLDFAQRRFRLTLRPVPFAGHLVVQGYQLDVRAVHGCGLGGGQVAGFQRIVAPALHAVHHRQDLQYLGADLGVAGCQLQCLVGQ
jgi:hypothetical protein